MTYYEGMTSIKVMGFERVGPEEVLEGAVMGHAGDEGGRVVV